MHIQEAMQQIVDDRENQKLQTCTTLILTLVPHIRSQQFQQTFPRVYSFFFFSPQF